MKFSLYTDLAPDADGDGDRRIWFWLRSRPEPHYSKWKTVGTWAP